MQNGDYGAKGNAARLRGVPNESCATSRPLAHRAGVLRQWPLPLPIPLLIAPAADLPFL